MEPDQNSSTLNFQRPLCAHFFGASPPLPIPRSPDFPGPIRLRSRLSAPSIARRAPVAARFALATQGSMASAFRAPGARLRFRLMGLGLGYIVAPKAFGAPCLLLTSGLTAVSRVKNPHKIIGTTNPKLYKTPKRLSGDSRGPGTGSPGVEARRDAVLPRGTECPAAIRNSE